MPVETVLIQLLKLFWMVSVHFSYIQKFHKLQIYLLKLPLYFSTFINTYSQLASAKLAI